MNEFQLLTGTSLPVFIGVTLIFMGGCAFMSGLALASTWRPAWQAVPYMLLLTLGDRFMIYALFKGKLFLASGYIIDALILTIIALLAYRIVRTRMMVGQYPWLYERAGLFRWKERPEAWE